MSWTDPQDGCPLCRMDEQTHWYYEDDELVIADTLQGSPFVVWKEHTVSVSTSTKLHIQGKVKEVFGDHDLKVRMNVVEDHWHAHIVDPDTEPEYLKDE